MVEVPAIGARLNTPPQEMESTREEEKKSKRSGKKSKRISMFNKNG